MKRVNSILVLVSIILIIFFSGCCGGGKKTTVVNEPSKTTTVGQELKDLQEAKESGAISEKEYEEAKKKILQGQ